MKVHQRDKNLNKLIPTGWIFGSLAFVTLYFQTNLADPINSPKLWVLLILAAWLLGYIVTFRKIIFSNKLLVKVFKLNILLLGFLLLAVMFTDFKYTAIFGDTQRRNGFISYLSLSIIFISTCIFVRLFNIKKLYFVTIIIGTISMVYAFMQATGNDFVKWNNPYNSVITTLGNPNFAAAVMAIMGVIIFAAVFIDDFNVTIRVFSILLTSLLLLAIYKSNAKQGLLSYFLGIGIFLIIWLWVKNSKLGIISLSTGIFIFIFSVLGMLQIGPFEKFLYKPSVSIRGFYWRAGVEMFKHNPIFGIGIDRYGSYFKQYREVNYPLRYGFDITSTNAHNTFIQFFATGGIFVGILYLVLNGFILSSAIKGIKKLEGNNRLLLAGVFSAWMSYHAQSFVSIDNIGISIWGWVLGGVIIGISVSANSSTDEDRKYLKIQKDPLNLSRILFSGTTTLLAIVLVATLYRGEASAYNSTVSVNLQDTVSRTYYRDLQLKVINTPLIDPYYSISSSVRLIQSGFTYEGVNELKKIYSTDLRNSEVLKTLALVFEELNKQFDAIIYRKELAELDPWDASNYFQLGKDYKAQGDLVNSKAMLNKILSFASNDPVAAKAKAELTP